MKNSLLTLIFLFSSFNLFSQLNFAVTDAITECDDIFQVDVIVTNFVDIQSMQFTIDWTEDYISLVSSSTNISGGFGGLGTANATDGYINFAWGFLAPTNINDNISIITLTFSVLNGYTGNSASISINSSQTAVIIQGTNGQNISNYTLTDSDITINDSTSPTINCVNNLDLVSGGGPLMVNDIEPDGMDNCTITGITYSSTGATILSGINDASGSFFNVGETILTYTITDGGNNTASCFTIINITENIFPTDLSFDFSDINISCEEDSFSVELVVTGFNDITSITMPLSFDSDIVSFSSYSIQNIDANNGAVGSVQSDIGLLNFAWFANPGQSVSNSISILTLNFNIIHAGVTSVNFDPNNTEITDNDGIILGSDISYGIGNIIIFDNDPPELTCPADINISAISNDLTLVSGLEPTILDNCDIDLFSYTMSGALTETGDTLLSEFEFPIGTTSISYSITDFGGNTDICDFNVIVSDSPNQGDLTFILGDTVVSCDNSTIVIPLSVVNFNQITSFQYSINWDPAIFNYDLNIDTFIINSFVLSGLSNIGENEVALGNITLAWVDTEAPIGLTLPNNTIIGYLTLTPLSITNGDVLFSDIPTPINVSNTDGIIDNSDINFLSGEITVIDTVPPVLDCMDDMLIELVGVNCIATVPLVNPNVTDNCSSNILITSSNSSTEFIIGTHEIVYYATDEEGNIDSCSFNIIVRNIQDIPQFIDCPSDSIIILTDGCDVSYNWSTPTAQPLCDNNISVTSNFDPNDVFEIGAHVITYISINSSGNSDTCSFSLIVEDGNVPVFNECPNNYVIELTNGECSTVIDLPFLYGSTPCEDTIIANSILPILPTYSPGVYDFSFEIVTQNNLRDTCSFNVTVIGNTTTQVANCINDTTVYLGIDNCETFFDWDPAIFTNNCEVVNVFSNFSPQNFPLGEYNIITTAESTIDTVVCTFNLSILDTISPFFTNCPMDVQISIDGSIQFDPSNILDSIFVNSSCDSVQVFYSELIAFDNCNVNVEQSDLSNLSSSSWYPIGTTNQIYVAQDDSNNQSSCSFNISIIVPSIMINIDPNLVCEGETVNINSTSFVNFEQYIWDAPIDIIDSALTINSVSTNQSGIYSVSVELNNGCVIGPVVDTLTVITNVIANNDEIIIVDGEISNINLFENDLINTNVPYTFTIISEPSHGLITDNGLGSITYVPEVDYFGQDEFAYEICYTLCNTLCSNAIVIIDNQNSNIECKIPTLLTPNNDGFNDGLFIQCIDATNNPNNKLTIYNQWGDEVYNAEPYSNTNPWKGTYKDKNLPDAVYFYIFQADENAEILRGTITIYR